MAAVLVIEDNQTMREGMVEVVAKMGHRVYSATDGPGGLREFDKRRIDFTITDLKMEGMDGLEVLRAIRRKDPQAVVMVVTAYGTVKTAVEAMKEGAFDFITKPFTPDVLRVKTAKALELAELRKNTDRLQQEAAFLREQLVGSDPLDQLVGSSDAMEHVRRTIRKVAPSDSTVLVMGESGTGKELVARALHRLSRRSEGPFIAVNCAALAEGVLESELFGHEKGAFTGAGKRRLGRFELAHRGTIFLDEISEISPAVQVKLLRVLQERQFERVGGEQTVNVDVRVIAATNRNLERAVERGRFRQDLFFRLAIVPIELPPLRMRTEDIEELVECFVTKLAKRTGKTISEVEPEVYDVLRSYGWPGNVRELENVVEQAMVFAESAKLRVEDLPANLVRMVQGRQGAVERSGAELRIRPFSAPLPELLDRVEKELIQQAFQRARGVKTECARLLGVKPSALYYKLDKYGIG